MNQQIKELHEKAQLLAKWRLGDLPADEKRQLETLMHGDKRYDSLLQLLGDADFVNSELESLRQTDYRTPCRDMEQRIARSNKALKRNRMLKIAAVLAVLVVGGAFWYHHDYTRVTPPVITQEVQLAMRQSRESGHAAANVESISTKQPSAIAQEVRQLYHVDEQFAEQRPSASQPIRTRNSG